MGGSCRAPSCRQPPDRRIRRSRSSAGRHFGDQADRLWQFLKPPEASQPTVGQQPGQRPLDLPAVMTQRRRGRPGWPRGPMTAGAASTSCSKSCESWVLAADNPTANGRPAASISRWYLDPGLPRSTGFAPTRSPHAAPAHSRCRWRPVTSRPGRRRRASPAADGAAAPTPRPVASRAAAASRSRRCRSQAPLPAAAARAPRPAGHTTGAAKECGRSGA